MKNKQTPLICTNCKAPMQKDIPHICKVNSQETKNGHYAPLTIKGDANTEQTPDTFKSLKTLNEEKDRILPKIEIKENPQFTFWYYVNSNMRGLAGGFNCLIVDKALREAIKETRQADEKMILEIIDNEITNEKITKVLLKDGAVALGTIKLILKQQIKERFEGK